MRICQDGTVIGPVFCGGGGKPFKQKSRKEPKGRIVQADQPFDIPAAASIIPGTQGAAA